MFYRVKTNNKELNVCSGLWATPRLATLTEARKIAEDLAEQHLTDIAINGLAIYIVKFCNEKTKYVF